MMEESLLASYEQIFHHHAQQWGLRAFDQEAEYYRWQHSALTREQLGLLQTLAERRHGNADPDADVAFYDCVAASDIFPILYSQRYDYYRVVGLAVASRLLPSSTVLDFGCGIGILTTLYAKLFPEVEFMGVDRSSVSIEVAREQAERFSLTNAQFLCWSAPGPTLGKSCDVVVSTQAVFQTETNPGLPSESWKTFERAWDDSVLIAAEQTTGLQARLDFLRQSLAPNGKMILFEKAQHLGRRVLLQRALSRRELAPNEFPTFLSFDSLGEQEWDGPLYVVKSQQSPGLQEWDEAPVIVDEQRLYGCYGEIADWVMSRFPQKHVERSWREEKPKIGPVDMEVGTFSECFAYGFLMANATFRGLIVGGFQDRPLIERFLYRQVRQADDEVENGLTLENKWLGTPDDEQGQKPSYENHSLAAQKVWENLPQRDVLHSQTLEESGGRQRHIELGKCADLSYVYWANTYDQRQLVVVEDDRSAFLQEYYEQSVKEE